MKSYLCTLTLVALTLTSCSESKISQCQKIGQISQKIYEQAESSRHTQDLDKVTETAKKFAVMAQELEQLSLSDLKLQTYKHSLSQVYQSYSQSTFLMIEAIKNKNIQAAKLAKEEVTLTSKNEKMIGEELIKYCQPSG